MMPSPPPASSEPEDEYARMEYRRDGFTEDAVDGSSRSTGADPPVGAAVGSAIDRPVAPDRTPDRPYDAHPGMPDAAYGFDAPDGTQASPPGTDELSASTRTPVPGEPAWQVGHPDDMISILTADHRAVEHLFTQLDTLPADPEHRRDLVDVAIAELMRHAAAEEQHLYPTVRRCVDGGEELADRELAGHGTAEELMNDLMHTDADDPRFVSLTQRFVETVRAHAREEEAELFPRLRQAVDAQTLIHLGTEVLSAKRLAPTRPHPSAPNHPPLNKVTGPLAGLIDHAVDSLTDRPTSIDELADRSTPGGHVTDPGITDPGITDPGITDRRRPA